MPRHLPLSDLPPPSRGQIVHALERLAEQATPFGRRFLLGRAAYAMDVPDRYWPTTVGAFVQLIDGWGRA